MEVSRREGGSKDGVSQDESQEESSGVRRSQGESEHGVEGKVSSIGCRQC